MGTRVTGGVNYVNLSASQLVANNAGDLIGIFCASASGSPTIKLWDNKTSAAGPILVNTFVPVGSTWYPLPFHFANGLFITIGPTVDCTVSWST